MSEYSRVLARIVPVPAEGNGAMVCRGTKVVLAGGAELPSVSKITLTAQVDDVWRANIECLCALDPIDVEAVIASGGRQRVNIQARLTWWRRVLLKLAGVNELGVTRLSSSEMEFQALPWALKKAAAKDAGTESTGPQ